MSQVATRRIPFKMFGLQRTGTNLMVALMQRNFVVESLEPGTEWKHGAVQEADRRWQGIPARFVLCVKNPYAWLLSCYRYFQSAVNVDWTVAPQFQADPTMAFDEFVTMPCYDFASPVDRWNRMYAYWLATLPADRTVVVRQEDQLQDQGRVLDRLERRLFLPRQHDDVRGIEYRVDIGAEIRGPMNREFYLTREYMMQYNPALLRWVNEKLDRPLMARFGYTPERWSLTRRAFPEITLALRPCTTDAAVVREVAADPYGLGQIKQSSADIRTAIDIGAHIGSTALLIRRHWPNSNVLAYEPWRENFRLLQLNTGRAAGVTTLNAAVVDDDSRSYAFQEAPAVYGGWDNTADGAVGSDGTESVTAVNLEHGINHFGGEVDLLKIGCSDWLPALVVFASMRGLLGKFRWICGSGGRGLDAMDRVRQLLLDTHSVEVKSAPCGPLFLARHLQLQTSFCS